MKLLSMFFLAASGIYSTQAILSAPLPDSNDIARLQQGEILIEEISDGRKGQTFEAHAIFPSSKTNIVAVITDFAHYPQFMPNVKRIDILEQGGEQTIINYYLELPLGQVKRYRLLLLQEEQGDTTIIQWQMLDWPEVPEDERIGNTSGFWVLQPYADRQTLVRYHVYTDPGAIPFGMEWIVEYLSESSIPDVLANTRDYAVKVKKDKVG